MEFVRRSAVPADFHPLILIRLHAAWLDNALEQLILFTTVGISAIIFFQETLMCLKVRLVVI